jgi:hypothetical protein
MELENKFLGTITLIDSIFNYLKISWAPYQVGGWGRPEAVFLVVCDPSMNEL